MISEDQLDEWERLSDRATEGPWSSRYSESRQRFQFFQNFGDALTRLRPVGECYLDNADAEFIAAARDAVPRLIARVRELEDKLRRYQYEPDDRTSGCARVVRLEKKLDEMSHENTMIWLDYLGFDAEAKWFARHLYIKGFCPHGDKENCQLDMCKEHDAITCWREFAKEAIKNG